ncbi:hypothetical protein PTKIN_Ptkin13bG0274400 [Pterospermum kingtungense]
MEEDTTIMMAALSTLRPSQLSDLSYSVLSLSFHHRRRLCLLLSSPCLFSLTLNHLHSLSFPHKTLLIARYLLLSLHHLTRHFQPPPPLLLNPSTSTMNDRDLDAVLLLLFLCETHHHNPEFLERPHSQWRQVLSNIFSDTMLLNITSTVTGVFEGAALVPYLEMVTRCRRFVKILGCGTGKEGKEAAASAAAVVALPAVEVRGGGVQCVICKEEMREGRDVCKLPCRHLFHWMCILPWLKKRNTCPCCRFQLPCDDLFGEIQRLWGVLVKASGKSLDDQEWT